MTARRCEKSSRPRWRLRPEWVPPGNCSPPVQISPILLTEYPASPWQIPSAESPSFSLICATLTMAAPGTFILASNLPSLVLRGAVNFVPSARRREMATLSHAVVTNRGICSACKHEEGCIYARNGGQIVLNCGQFEPCPPMPSRPPDKGRMELEEMWKEVFPGRTRQGVQGFVQ